MKTFRVLAIADIHMSNRLPYARPTEHDRTDRLDDQLRVWEQVRRVARERQVDSIFLLGDLFDKSTVDAVTLTHTVSAIVGLGVETFILPGNHDANSVRGGRFTVEAFGAMGHDNIQVIGETAGHRMEVPLGSRQLVFHPVAFRPVARLVEEIEAIQATLDASAVNVLLLHASIVGAHHAGWECDDGLDADAICAGFDLVLAGHFHAHQLFGPNGMYLGAPMHHHFGDIGRGAGFWFFEFKERGKIKREFISTAAPTFHVCSSLEEAHRAVPGDYLRYSLKATHANWMKIKPAAQARCAALAATGVKADFKHLPVYHHESRLTTVSEATGAAPSVEDNVTEYLQAAGVNTTGLDLGRLKKMGLEALAAARGAHGFD